MVEYKDMTVEISISKKVKYKDRHGENQTINFGADILTSSTLGATQLPDGENFASGGAVNDDIIRGYMGSRSAFTGSATNNIEIYINPLAPITPTQSDIRFTMEDGKQEFLRNMGEVNIVTTIAHELYSHAYLYMFGYYEISMNEKGGRDLSSNHGGGSDQLRLEKKINEAERTAESNYCTHKKNRSLKSNRAMDKTIEKIRKKGG